MILMWTTKPRNPVSFLIRFFLESKVSHFCTAFETNAAKFVLEQKLILGFEMSLLSYFLSHNEVILSLQPKDLDEHEEADLMKAMMVEFSGSKYDDGNFFYQFYRLLLWRFLKKPLPVKSSWGNKRDVLCTGHARVLYRLKPEWFSEPVEDFDIVSLQGLYDNMLASGHFWSDKHADRAIEAEQPLSKRPSC